MARPILTLTITITLLWLSQHHNNHPPLLLPTHAAHPWLALGKLPAAHSHQPIDLLWTWANHSPPATTTPHLHRQHDELRFSLRSSRENLPEPAVRQRTIIAEQQPHWLQLTQPTIITLTDLLHTEVVKRHPPKPVVFGFARRVQVTP
ncbi:hypothetical protein PTTG_10080 [Puccinia triticina 1-1 BBBD Race 1]|uniref:Uncharacterized protein n=1 Tax=Puccinia triticina (isolate 1-1 / race 1 (BBBD)) TaxID=630390 RepID=A0A0C4FA39_PUCT1|nr:hypothetical protein PTTG_10080 [Puccinia triticina 1-1 BBBD Race 1]